MKTTRAIKRSKKPRNQLEARNLEEEANLETDQLRINSRLLIKFALASLSMFLLTLYLAGYYAYSFFFSEPVRARQLEHVTEVEDPCQMVALSGPRDDSHVREIVTAIAMLPALVLALFQFRILPLVKEGRADEVYMVIRHGWYARALPFCLTVAVLYLFLAMGVFGYKTITLGRVVFFNAESEEEYLPQMMDDQNWMDALAFVPAAILSALFLVQMRVLKQTFEAQSVNLSESQALLASRGALPTYAGTMEDQEQNRQVELSGLNCQMSKNDRARDEEEGAGSQSRVINLSDMIGDYDVRKDLDITGPIDWETSDAFDTDEFASKLQHSEDE